MNRVPTQRVNVGEMTTDEDAELLRALHAEHGEALPGQLTERLLSVRAFDGGHLMLGGVVIDGAKLQETAERLLGDDEVAYLHVHNAAPGCFAARIERAGSRSARGLPPVGG